MANTNITTPIFPVKPIFHAWRALMEFGLDSREGGGRENKTGKLSKFYRG
jgi:hypothetical protein